MIKREFLAEAAWEKDSQVLQKTAFSLDKSRLAPGSILRLVGYHHAENGKRHMKVVLTAP